jgi:hypothetical protein
MTARTESPLLEEMANNGRAVLLRRRSNRREPTQIKATFSVD